MSELTAPQQTLVKTITLDEPVYVALHLIERLSQDPNNLPVLKAALQTESTGTRQNHTLIKRLQVIIPALESRQPFTK